MIQTVKKKNVIAMFLALVFMVLTIAPDGFGQRRRYRHHTAIARPNISRSALRLEQ